MSIFNDGASAHRNDAIVNSVTDHMNSFTCPNLRVSHPVRGRDIAFATPNEVMTQVPWSGETPRSPEIAGIDTFAMDVSSTFMNVASDSAMVPIVSALPVSGCGCGTPAAPACGTAAGPAPATAGPELAAPPAPGGAGALLSAMLVAPARAYRR